jgi:hypothetical protein
LLQHLNGDGKLPALRFGEKKVHMFGHDNIPENAQTVPTSDAFESGFEQVARSGRLKKRLPAIATERDKMDVASLLIPIKTSGHEGRIEAVGACGE